MLRKIKIFTLFFSILFIFIGLSPIAHSQKEDKNIYGKLQSKLNKLNSISFNFVLREDPKYKGSIKAKKGNRYDIRTPQRRLICNGKNIWNYTEIDKKVVISSYEVESENSISIENIFFNIVKNFRPIETSFFSFQGKDCYKLKLTPINQKATELKYLIICIAKEDFSILYVQSENNNEVQTWEISNLNINTTISDKHFEFKVPEGTQVIDLR